MRSSQRRAEDTPKFDLQHLVLYAMLGTLMFASKLALEALPNVHMLGMLTMVYTLVYRRYALIPIYVNVLLVGLYAGFNLWWVPYLYLWTVLWGATMLLPRHTPRVLRRFVPPRLRRPLQALMYLLVCGLHGLLYGTLYAPFQALAFHLDFRGMLTWIAAGFPWDVVHCVGNLAMGTLILPLSLLLARLERGVSHN